jgi:hypothetical protein
VAAHLHLIFSSIDVPVEQHENSSLDADPASVVTANTAGGEWMRFHTWSCD